MSLAIVSLSLLLLAEIVFLIWMEPRKDQVTAFVDQAARALDLSPKLFLLSRAVGWSPRSK